MQGDQFFEENPFAAPVQLPAPVASSGGPTAPKVNTSGLDNYQPFTPSSNMSAPTTQPTPNSAHVVSVNELEKRQRELEARAQELDKREAEQRRIEAENARLSGATQNNFPPLPGFCPLKPCFYQAIDVDIMPDHRPMVILGFRLWLAYTAIIMVNFFGAILYFAAGDQSSGGPLFGMAIFATLICPPASYVCWFRPLYKAFKTNSSFNFFLFFFVMFAQIVTIALQSLGFFNMGTCGLGYALTAIKTGWLSAILFAIMMAFIGVGLGCTYLLVKVHGFFRNSGATFDQAKKEFMTGVANDPTVRGVAAQAAVSSFNAAATTPSNNPAGKF